MDEADDRIVDKVQALSDIELAVLLCLVADQHCIVEADAEVIDRVGVELQIVRWIDITEDSSTWLMIKDCL